MPNEAVLYLNISGKIYISRDYAQQQCVQQLLLHLYQDLYCTLAPSSPTCTLSPLSCHCHSIFSMQYYLYYTTLLHLLQHGQSTITAPPLLHHTFYYISLPSTILALQYLFLIVFVSTISLLLAISFPIMSTLYYINPNSRQELGLNKYLQGPAQELDNYQPRT